MPEKKKADSLEALQAEILRLNVRRSITNSSKDPNLEGDS